MTGSWSVFIERLTGGGFLVREDLNDQYFEPNLKSVLKRVAAALADSGDSGLSEAPDASEAADESLADQVVEALEKLEGADPDDGATIFLARRLVQDISRPRGTVSPAAESRIVEIVLEKLRVKRLLEAHSPATRRRRKTR